MKFAFALIQTCMSLAPVTAAGELSPVAGAAPPDLALPDLDGRQRRLGEFEGQVVLVNFWASWCTPCVKEMPSIQRLAESMRGKPFAVVGVNVGEGRLRVKTAAARLGIEFPVLLDRESVAFDAWGASGLPTTYLLDREGAIRYVGRGPLEWDSAAIIDVLEQIGGWTSERAPAGFNPASVCPEPACGKGYAR